nr:retrotransposon Gag domain-containing protein [Tanacetum cinerariifolium]
MFESPKPRHDHSESPRKRDPEGKTLFKRLEKGVFHRLGDKGKSMSAYSNDSRRRSYHSSHKDTECCYRISRSRETEFASEKYHNKRASSRMTEALSESEGSVGGHWKSKPKRQNSSVEDDLKNASKIQLKFTISSSEMENPRRSLCEGKFKPPPPMTTRVEKRNASKLCEFHGEVGHTTDECMHLKRQIEEMIKARKLSHLIKELKQSNAKDQAKAAKKGETSGKEKPLDILM